MTTLKKNTRMLFALIIGVVMLFSTNGFSIYSHYCSKSNTQSHSLIEGESPCKQASEQEKNCCKSHQTTNNDACCTNIEQVVKLNTNIILSQTAPEIINIEQLLIFSHKLPVFENTLLKKTILNWATQYIYKVPLPTFLSLIQVYLI